MDKISKIIWNVLNQIDSKKMDYLKYYKTSINIEYNDIINVWKQFILREDLKLSNSKIELDYSSLKIGLMDTELSIILEVIFQSQIINYKEDALIFYLRNTNKLLLLLKTYKPVLESDSIQLPYWSYFIEFKHLKEFFNKNFEDDENLIIIGFTI